MITNWDEMRYWQSGEWDVVQERHDDLDNAGVLFNPPRHLLFSSLDACPFQSVKVVLVGQDPYPDRNYCTGLAFSIPKTSRTIPPTLDIILEEYANDLHYPKPTSGDLSRWTQRGVLLWNTVPSCGAGQSNSHNWDEWRFLSEEIISELSAKGGIVFCFIGSIAQKLGKLVDTEKNRVLTVAHPAAERYGLNSRVKNKFTGSRIFTTINGKLCELGQQPVDWRLT